METYEFIVVGSGPSGALLASRLARASSKPSVLLIEAGGPQPSQELLDASKRWTAYETQPDLNWGYKSIPQSGLNGRSVDISRGKALGGTSNINFMCWTPPNEDYLDEWQSRVGGNSLFGWHESQRLLGDIVKYNLRTLVNSPSNPLNGLTERPVSEFVKTKNEAKGGLFDVEYSTHLKKGDAKLLDGAREHGFQMNPTMTLGNSLGFGIMPSMSTTGFVRTTPSEAFLTDTPTNLFIKTGLEATRILFENKVAKAVEVNGGEQIFKATRCVVLSAGSINTPKLLMLSGVGPAGHLSDQGIPLVADIPGVGQHLTDHWFLPLMWEMEEQFSGIPIASSTDPYPNQDLFNCVVGFDRDNTIMAHDGFSKLPVEEQRFLQRANTPNLEMICVPNWPPGTQPYPKPSILIAAVHLTPQARGNVTLSSANWRDAPSIDINLLGDEAGLDLASSVVYARKVVDFMENTASLSRHIVAPILRPKLDTEADIITYAREKIVTVWHPCCTARMGPQEDSEGDSVVDPSFRVRGLENLRIADLSVTPLIPNFHPVSVALLVGAWAAEQMIKDFGL